MPVLYSSYHGGMGILGTCHHALPEWQAERGDHAGTWNGEALMEHDVCMA